MKRFIKRENIRFHKRKFGKGETAEECITEFEAIIYKLGFLFPSTSQG